jgi:cyclopropane fatty-acyl-phospholipid synthase-like methyltransferase
VPDQIALTDTSNDQISDRSLYWDDYYAAVIDDRRPLPSQFAVFVAGELENAHSVIEFGCGTGRDAIFFASRGHQVMGVDASHQAVKTCEGRAAGLGEQATFVAARIDDPDLANRLQAPELPLVVYARFFVHAISDDEEQAFLDLAAELTSAGDRLAVEYRTIRDLSGAKVTQQHYRRFVTPATFQARALARGFDVEYSIEGFGFAKYKSDDAYVARTIFVRR